MDDSSGQYFGRGPRKRRKNHDIVNKISNQNVVIIFVLIFMFVFMSYAECSVDYDSGEVGAEKNNNSLPGIEVKSTGKQLSSAMTMYSFEYKKGHRFVGDEVLLSIKKTYRFPIQNVTIQIKFPNNDTRVKTHVITNFIVWISQDSLNSKGFQIRGGIYCHDLLLRVEASHVQNLTMEVLVHGIDTIILPNKGMYEYRCYDNVAEMPLQAIVAPFLEG